MVDEPDHDNSLDGIQIGAARPRLMFDRKCKHTIEDMLNYRYPDKNEMKEPGADRADKPMKKADHGPEALGRLCAGLFGQFGKRGTRVHQASFTRDDAKVSVGSSDWTKSAEFRRPAAAENRRTSFPKVNGALGNYLSGVYDE